MDTVSELSADQRPDFTSTVHIEERLDTENQELSATGAGPSSQPTASLPSSAFQTEHGGGRAQRGPLPPTPIDELSLASSNQQPSSTKEIQNHRGRGPNAPYSYKHHDPQTPISDGRGQSGRNRTPKSAPPPVPVSGREKERERERERRVM